MQNEDVKQRIVEYIREKGSATYSEIEEIMTAAGYEWQGKICACSDVNTNVVLWQGWNSKAFSLVAEMLKSGEITREPCHVINYLVGGKYLNLPLVKRYTEYKTEHWLPCIFVLGKGNADS